ncbi:MAG: hypothetical protein ACK4EX_07305 [Thermaurantimonas sp.]|uniref:hypothetical protein n=1 Tax=Thermaurantimonas sp. TaxID=2681568 RepID=UPI00391A3E19
MGVPPDEGAIGAFVRGRAIRSYSPCGMWVAHRAAVASTVASSPCVPHPHPLQLISAPIPYAGIA